MSEWFYSSSKPNNNWSKCLNIGKLGELLVSAYYKSLGYKTKHINQKHGQRGVADIEVYNKSERFVVEVKFNQNYFGTNNAPCEVYSTDEAYRKALLMEGDTSDEKREHLVSSTMSMANAAKYIIHIDANCYADELEYCKELTAYIFHYPTYRNYCRSIPLTSMSKPWKGSDKGAHGVLVSYSEGVDAGLQASIDLLPFVQDEKIQNILHPKPKKQKPRVNPLASVASGPKPKTRKTKNPLL